MKRFFRVWLAPLPGALLMFLGICLVFWGLIYWDLIRLRMPGSTYDEFYEKHLKSFFMEMAKKEREIE